MSVKRIVTCDNCGKDRTHLPIVHLSGGEDGYEFCDLNCLECWLGNRYRQRQGDKLAITYIDKPRRPNELFGSGGGGDPVSIETMTVTR